MEKDLPEKLMKDVYWAFSKGVFGNREEFDEKVRDYHIRIKGEDVWRSNEEIFPHSSIQICYEFWAENGEEEIEAFFEIEADNGETFSAGELLFKINNAVAENVSRGDHIFFEGLTLSKETHDGKPFYWLYLGS